MVNQRIGTTGIYKIVNPNGKIYIGQSINIERREREYNGGRCKGQKKLYYSILKYGWENHIHEILEECSIEQLNEREIYWGMYYDALGKNGLCCMLGSGKGYISDETLERIRISSKNRIYTHSPETLVKMRKPKPEGFGKKIGNITRGRILGPRSEEIKLKISTCSKGRKNSEKSKNNISVGRTGKGYIPVLQFDLQNNFIKEWPSIKQAKNELNIINISVALTGGNKTAGGFIWKYKII